RPLDDLADLAAELVANVDGGDAHGGFLDVMTSPQGSRRALVAERRNATLLMRCARAALRAAAACRPRRPRAMAAAARRPRRRAGEFLVHRGRSSGVSASASPQAGRSITEAMRSILARARQGLLRPGRKLALATVPIEVHGGVVAAAQAQPHAGSGSVVAVGP